MNLKFKMLLAISLAISSFVIHAQTTIDLELRPRTEYRQGFRAPLADTLKPALTTVQRSRLDFSYTSTNLDAVMSFQDVRIWGDNDLKTSNSKLELYQAWFKYKLNSRLDMKMGRQPLSYDDLRLFSAPPWSSYGLAHDLLMLKYKHKIWTIDAGYALNNSADTLLNAGYSMSSSKNYKTLGFVWGSNPIRKGVKLSYIGVVEGFEKKTDMNKLFPRITYGGNLFFDDFPKQFGGTLTAYGQTGYEPSVKGKVEDVALNAYMFAALLYYKPTEKSQFLLGFDLYSGTNNSTPSNVSNTFNRLYGALHIFNGYMEYYIKLPKEGLLNLYGGYNICIKERLKLDFRANAFAFNEDFVYKQEVQQKYLGSELDFTLIYKLQKDITLQTGYSCYFNSSSTAKYFKAENVPFHFQQWAYLMFTVKPQLYKSKS